MNPPISEAAAEALREPGQGLPVFVSADGRPRRVLRLVGRVVAGLTALWLGALVAGALGLGDLPGVSLPRVGAGDSSGTPAREAAPASTHHAAKATHGSSAGDRSHHGGGSANSRPGPAARPSLPGARRPGALVNQRSGSGGSPGVGQGSSTSAPNPAQAPARSPAPAHSGTTPTPPAGSHATGPAAATDSPGATYAQPSPSATEHSQRWSTAGG